MGYHQTVTVHWVFLKPFDFVTPLTTRTYVYMYLTYVVMAFAMAIFRDTFFYYV